MMVAHKGKSWLSLGFRVNDECDNSYYNGCGMVMNDHQLLLTEEGLLWFCW